jgi:mannose/cellobiose epimerase-like protein (N-acyl-D-glucosamine 2-epimerase family)
MKKAFLIFLFVQRLFAQPAVNSPYLQNPGKIYGYVDSCARFWMKAYDPVNGGFYVNVNRQGNLSGSTEKNTLNQSRDAYGFIRAFQLTGDTLYLRYAQYALDFMFLHSWDHANGGWFNDISSAGVPTDPFAVKTAYFQHYAALGIAAAFEATRDETDWRYLMNSYEYNDMHLWDADATNFGYYDYVSADGTSPTDKSFNATVDAITTHVLHLYLLTGEERYRKRLLDLADNMMNQLAASSVTQQIGFAERYTTTWQIRSGTSDETRTIMGHVLKTAWCLARIYQLEPDPVYLATAESLAQNVLTRGYDHQNGGPYKDYNRITGEMMMYGISDTAKAWWQMEQAVTSGLMLYQLTGKEEYLRMADETLDFFMKFFVDHVYGDVFENTNKYGGMIPQWGTTKGNGGKAGYHSIELGYYTYLYGKLLLKKEDASLYYRITPLGSARQLRMRPIAVPDGYLKIASVTLDGIPFNGYDSTNLVLNVPPGVGGTFRVTYAPATVPVSVAENSALPGGFALQQNYPNPFNPVTRIQYTVAGVRGSGLGSREAGARNVELKVYDILGREVATLINEQKSPGTYEVQFSGANLASGVYIYRLHAGSYVQARTMVLVR